jgi:sugar phosphate isomerase/epimerase
MRYGYCADIKFLDGDTVSRTVFEGIAEAGFHYVELPLYMLSACEKTDALKKELRGAGLFCLACNVFFPAHIKLVGKDMDKPAIQRYLERMLPFAREFGVETLVFGNGGARRVPEGESRETVWGDLRWIVEEMEKYAGANGVQIAVEPLNKTETNIVNSYAEAVELTRGLRHVGTMIDSYHVLMDGQSYDDVLLYPERLLHLHTAYSKERLILSPTDDITTFGAFVKAVKETGYDKKISIEGNVRHDTKAQIKGSLAALKELFK